MSDQVPAPAPAPQNGVTTQIMILQGILYTAIAVLTPCVSVISGNEPLTGRSIAGLVITSLIAGATALKAFLSTSFAGSGGKS